MMLDWRTRVDTDFAIIRLFQAFINIAEKLKYSILFYIISHGLRKLYTNCISITPSASTAFLDGYYRILILLYSNITDLKNFRKVGKETRCQCLRWNFLIVNIVHKDRSLHSLKIDYFIVTALVWMSLANSQKYL
jgi:hypothetical protein